MDILMLTKTKLNTMKVLISKALIDSNINHDKLFHVKRIWWNSSKNQKSWKCCGIYHIRLMETYCVIVKKILQTKILVLEELNKID